MTTTRDRIAELHEEQTQLNRDWQQLLAQARQDLKDWVVRERAPVDARLAEIQREVRKLEQLRPDDPYHAPPPPPMTLVEAVASVPRESWTKKGTPKVADVAAAYGETVTAAQIAEAVAELDA